MVEWRKLLFNSACVLKLDILLGIQRVTPAFLCTIVGLAVSAYFNSSVNSSKLSVGTARKFPEKIPLPFVSPLVFTEASGFERTLPLACPALSTAVPPLQWPTGNSAGNWCASPMESSVAWLSSRSSSAPPPKPSRFFCRHFVYTLTHTHFSSPTHTHLLFLAPTDMYTHTVLMLDRVLGLRAAFKWWLWQCFTLLCGSCHCSVSRAVCLRMDEAKSLLCRWDSCLCGGGECKTGLCFIRNKQTGCLRLETLAVA